MSELNAHAQRIAEIVSRIEEGSDDAVKAQLFELLENIDHLHRSALWRLFERLSELGGKGLVERLAADEAIHTLFVLYDLIPAHPLTPVASSTPVSVSAPGRADFVPLSEIGGVAPRFEVAFDRADLPDGTLQAVEIARTPVLLVGAAREEDLRAYRNACPGSILPLHMGTLVEEAIHCPWHGCRFDRLSGKLIDGPHGMDLERFPVDVQGDIIRVATASRAAARP